MKTRYDEMRDACIAFHRAHPQVYLLFDKFTKDRISRGFQHYGAMAVFQRIRWETDEAETGEDQFKINNNFCGFYARAWMQLNPKHNGFFRQRELISKRTPAVNRGELRPSHFDRDLTA